MTKLQIGSTFFFMLITTLPSLAANTSTIKVTGRNSPPQCYKDEKTNETKGMMCELVVEACKRAKLNCEFEWYPFKRALLTAAEGENYVVPGVSRTPEREKTYEWLINVFKFRRVFLTKGPKINSFDEGKQKLKKIAVANASSQHEELTSKGFQESQFAPQHSGASELEMLDAGHVDAWYHTSGEINWRIKSQPQYKGKFTFGAPLSSSDQYVVASKKFDPELFKKFKTALSKMKSDGTVERILNNYKDYY
jgi:ABC-type amino acid transport substrate-binding protein